MYRYRYDMLNVSIPAADGNCALSVGAEERLCLSPAVTTVRQYDTTDADYTVNRLRLKEILRLHCIHG
jgi:hypothetical protein